MKYYDYFYSHYILFFHTCCLNLITIFIFPPEEKNIFSTNGTSMNSFVNIMSAREKQFDVHFQRIKSFHFLSKEGFTVFLWGMNWMERCLFPARDGILTLMFNGENVYPYLYLDLACKQLCFPPRKRYELEKRKYQKNNNCSDSINQ